MRPVDETWLSAMVIGLTGAVMGALIGWMAVPCMAVGGGLVWWDARRGVTRAGVVDRLVVVMSLVAAVMAIATFIDIVTS